MILQITIKNPHPAHHSSLVACQELSLFLHSWAFSLHSSLRKPEQAKLPSMFFISEYETTHLWYMDFSFLRQNSLLTPLLSHIISLLFQLNHSFDHTLRFHISSCLFLLTMVIQEVHQTEPTTYTDSNNPVPPSFHPGPKTSFLLS